VVGVTEEDFLIAINNFIPMRKSISGNSRKNRMYNFSYVRRPENLCLVAFLKATRGKEQRNAFA
jgi:hypothetical protein